MGEDRQDTTGSTSTERVSVPQAADHLGTTVDALRKRVQRRTIPYERDEDGRVWILLDTGRPRQDTDQDPDQPPSDSTALISAKDETIADLREQLEAERQAHADARMMLMAALEKIPPAIEPPREARGAPETAREEPEGAEPPNPLREAGRRPQRARRRAGPYGRGSSGGRAAIVAALGLGSLPVRVSSKGGSRSTRGGCPRG